MRKFIDIIKEAQALGEAVLDKAGFGTAALSRSTDPKEQIEFKVFCDAGAEKATKAVITKYPIRFETHRLSTKLSKLTFVCTGTRETAETLTRQLKLLRVPATVRID